MLLSHPTVCGIQKGPTFSVLVNDPNMYKATAQQQLSCGLGTCRPVLETRIPGQNMTPCKFEELMAKRKISDSEEYKLVKGLNIFYQVCCE